MAARRALITFAATSAGVALVMSFRTPHTTGVSASAPSLETVPDPAAAGAPDPTTAPDAPHVGDSTTTAPPPPGASSSTTQPAPAAVTTAAPVRATTSSTEAASPATAPAVASTTTTSSVVRIPTTAPPFQTTTTTRAPARGVPAGVAGTFDGDVVTTRFGNVQVEISVTGGKITDVTALVLPTERARSAAISQFAGPQLRQEALTAQTAAIDIVSGATYTSMGYAQSLQSAIDRA